MLERRWVMLAVIFITRTAMGLMFQSLAAIGPLMIPDLSLSYSQYGVLLGLFMLPGAIMALPGGVLGQRYGSRHVAGIGLAMMALGGLVTAESPGFALAAVGRVASGVGGVLLNVALAKMVSDWFTGREISTAMGIMLTSFPVGMALAVALLGGVATAYSWRAAVLLTALVAAAGLLVLISLYRDPPSHASADAGRSPASSRLSSHDIALSATAGLAWGSFNAGFFVLGSFAPGYLVARGASVAGAGFIVSLGIWVSLVFVPLGGYAADRLQRPNLVMVAGCLMTALFGALMPVLPGPALWFVLMGITFGLPPGAMMSLLPRAIPAERLSTGLGVYYTLFYLTIAAALPLAGLVRDLSASAAAPLFFAAGATAVTAPCLALFRALERRPPDPLQV